MISGPDAFLYLLAFFSLQLGVLNLMPIPILDGGHIMILDDARFGYTLSGSARQSFVVAGRDTYRDSDGETHVALGDLDEDGIDEMVVGFRRSARGELQVFKDVFEQNGRIIGSGNFLSVEGLDAAMFPSPNH